MPDSFDLRTYADYVGRRWRIIAISCLTAAALAGTVSLLLPRQFTATAKIVIEPPAGSDMRAAMAVSPIYLESLRTYEHFASSDQLFSQALEHFQLRRLAPGRTLESWKARVLEVGIPRNTKILEISTTLEDPKQAHNLAVYLAEETIKLNRSLTREGDSEFTKDAMHQLETARTARDEVEAQWRALQTKEPVEIARAEVATIEERQYSAQRDLLDAEALSAELSGSEKALASIPETERAELRERIGSTRAQAEYLRSQVKELDRQLTEKRALLARRTALRDEIDLRRRSAQATYEAALTRVRETEAAVGYRGDRLKLIDPGIVPERPSSPRILVNVGAALLFAAVASLLYVSLQFAYSAPKSISTPLAIRRSGTAND